MKLTLIRMPVLLPILLLSSQIVLAADPVPKFDTRPSCRSADATGVIGRNAASCERDEQTRAGRLSRNGASLRRRIRRVARD